MVNIFWFPTRVETVLTIQEKRTHFPDFPSHHLPGFIKSNREGLTFLFRPFGRDSRLKRVIESRQFYWISWEKSETQGTFCLTLWTRSEFTYTKYFTFYDIYTPTQSIQEQRESSSSLTVCRSRVPMDHLLSSFSYVSLILLKFL